MDKLTLFLVRMLTLQCFLHWCSSDEDTLKWTHTLESFNRWNTDYRFLTAKWDKGAFELSFNGSKEDANTTFIFRHKDNRKHEEFRILLANDPNYFLAVDDNRSGLVVKKLSDITGDLTGMANYNFQQGRISIVYSKEKPKVDVFQVIEPQILKGRYIKSKKSGLVSLGSASVDRGCWIQIKRTRHSAK